VRRRSLFPLLVLLLPLSCGKGGKPPSAPKGPLGVELRVESRKVKLGEPLEVTLLFRKDPGVEAEPPSLEAIQAKAGEFRLLPGKSRTCRLPGGGTLLERRYTLFPFKTGRVALPALVVKGRFRGKDLSARTSPVVLRVESVLKEKTSPVEEPRKPLDVPAGGPWGLLAGAAGGALLLALLLYLFLRGKGRDGRPAAPPPLPPHVEALRALARIRKRPRTTPEEVEAMVVDASGVVRRYIEKRFGLRAPERTTEEFLAEAGSSGLFGEEERRLLESFLFECDRAKFAGWTPPPEKQSALLDAATAFVERTAPGAGEGAG